MGFFSKKKSEPAPVAAPPPPAPSYGSSVQQQYPSYNQQSQPQYSQNRNDGPQYHTGARNELFADARGPSQNTGGDFDRQYSQKSQLADDDEDDEVEAIKQQTRFIKAESLAHTRDTVRVAREAEETARASLAKLGDQSERLANAERNIDLGKAHNDRAADQAKEIVALNRSIFRPNIQFNKKAKRDAEEQRILARHIEEKSEREDVRRTAYDSRARVEEAFKHASAERGALGLKQPTSKSERSRYQFEADEEDDQVEAEIDENLNEISDLASRLKILATAAGREVDSQNARLDGMTRKADRLDDKINIGIQRLNNIK